jgi:hypothetical protein
MNSDTSEQLAVELARHVVPVQPIARMRVVLTQVLAVGSVVAAVFLTLKGVTPLLLASLVMWPFALVVAGLCLVGAGAVVAGLGMSVPGRDGAVRAGLASAGLGAVLALVLAPLLRLREPGPALLAGLSSDLGCLLSACAVGILPAAVALWFVTAAAPRRPLLAVVVASIGAVGLGALAAQAACPYSDVRHMLLGHAGAPWLGGLLLAVPLGLLMRRLRA